MPVAIKGSGGGSVTLDAGAASADTTLTIPNVTGTILQSGTAVTVAQGGTGAATLAANNVLLGNGTSALQVVAPGTTGNLLTSNGTTWQSTAPAAVASGFSNISVGTYTAASNSSGTPLVWNSSGSLTFTVPTGITKVKVTVVGGGGGSGAAGFGSAGSGAGGGGSAIKIISGLTPGGTIAVTIGGAGGAGTTSSVAPTSGGTSSFAAYCSATGGSAGTNFGGSGGTGGIGSSGDLNIRGSGGGVGGSIAACSSGIGGTGGSSILGGGGAGAYGDVGKAGGAYGAGAGGSGGGNGAVGASGVVVVEY